MGHQVSGGGGALGASSECGDWELLGCETGKASEGLEVPKGRKFLRLQVTKLLRITKPLKDSESKVKMVAVLCWSTPVLRVTEGPKGKCLNELIKTSPSSPPPSPYPAVRQLFLIPSTSQSS